MDHFKARLYLSATIGWLGAIAAAVGIVALIFGQLWGGKTLTFGFAIAAAATEIDPTDQKPWWFKAGLALLSAIGALLFTKGV